VAVFVAQTGAEKAGENSDVTDERSEQAIHKASFFGSFAAGFGRGLIFWRIAKSIQLIKSSPACQWILFVLLTRYRINITMVLVL
jgi:hypothetical protein